VSGNLTRSMRPVPAPVFVVTVPPGGDDLHTFLEGLVSAPDAWDQLASKGQASEWAVHANFAANKEEQASGGSVYLVSSAVERRIKAHRF
jgi:hypothetical protein